MACSKIRPFLTKRGIGDEAITAVEKYGVESEEDFCAMEETEFDKLEAKPFQKNRLKEEWKKLTGQGACAAVCKGAQQQNNNGNSRGNIQAGKIDSLTQH